MSDNPGPDRHYERLRKIDIKLAWIIALLVLLNLNTCDLADDLKDAMRGHERAAASDAEH